MPSREQLLTRTKKIVILFFLLFIAMIILVFSVTKTMVSYRRLPTLLTTKKELAVRGDILSSDGFKISSSKKLYKAAIDTRCLDINKQELFVKLFSIYSDIDEDKIIKKIKRARLKKPGNIVLSYNINSRVAKNLKELGFKLRKLKVFKSIKVKGGKILHGLDVVESGEKRIYSYKTSLTPIVGYISKYESKKGKTKVKGVKGLERYYNDILNETKDGILKGERDVLSYISFNKESIIKARQDGASLVLNIPLKLQKNIEMILDHYKEKLIADEIMASVIDNKTGKILTLATSNRFYPNNIKEEEYGNLNINAIEYQFEPGSVIKPITMALVLDKKRVRDDELLFAYNKGKKNKHGEYKRGAYKLGRHLIRDDHQFKKNYITPSDIIVYSSNIGILQLAQRLKAEEFSNGMKSFGITEKTGIDLSNEKIGVMPELYKFRAGEAKGKDNVYKATVSYGQGMTSTFMQLLKAYSVFNNDGKITTLRIVSHILTPNGKKITIKNGESKQIISPQTANKIRKMLIRTVNIGTGEAAKVDGLEIGGKTGTAQVVRNGKYQKIYISSFFGFANDSEKRYTIGVTSINPVGTKWWHHYASYAAAPVFKEIVKTLVKLNYLSPKSDIKTK